MTQLTDAMGGCKQQVRSHLGAARKIGLTATELDEVIIHTAPFAGFSTAINALKLLNTVHSEAGSGE